MTKMGSGTAEREKESNKFNLSDQEYNNIKLPSSLRECADSTEFDFKTDQVYKYILYIYKYI